MVITALLRRTECIVACVCVCVCVCIRFHKNCFFFFLCSVIGLPSYSVDVCGCCALAVFFSASVCVLATPAMDELILMGVTEGYYEGDSDAGCCVVAWCSCWFLVA